MSTIAPINNTALLQQITATPSQSPTSTMSAKLLNIVDTMDISPQAKQLAEQTIQQFAATAGQATTAPSTTSPSGTNTTAQGISPLRQALHQMHHARHDFKNAVNEINSGQTQQGTTDLTQALNELSQSQQTLSQMQSNSGSATTTAATASAAIPTSPTISAMSPQSLSGQDIVALLNQFSPASSGISGQGGATNDPWQTLLSQIQQAGSVGGGTPVDADHDSDGSSSAASGVTSSTASQATMTAQDVAAFFPSASAAVPGLTSSDPLQAMLSQLQQGGTSGSSTVNAAQNGTTSQQPLSGQDIVALLMQANASRTGLF